MSWKKFLMAAAATALLVPSLASAGTAHRTNGAQDSAVSQNHAVLLDHSNARALSVAVRQALERLRAAASREPQQPNTRGMNTEEREKALQEYNREHAAWEQYMARLQTELDRLMAKLERSREKPESAAANGGNLTPRRPDLSGGSTLVTRSRNLP